MRWVVKFEIDRKNSRVWKSKVVNVSGDWLYKRQGAMVEVERNQVSFIGGDRFHITGNSIEVDGEGETRVNLDVLLIKIGLGIKYI